MLNETPNHDRDTPKHKPRGRHPHHRLTDLRVRALRVPGRYADGNGLYLVVEPSGAKRWIWRGVIQGKRSDLGLGGAQLVRLVDARAKAMSCRRLARDGGNPKVERARAKQVVPTFKAAARQVHAEHRKTFRNEKHAAQWLQSLENDVFAILGDMPIDSIGSSHVLRVLTPIWTQKPETARRVKQRMKVVFDWAKASGFRTGDNPTDGITKVLPKHKGGKKHLAALPYRLVPKFVADLRAIGDMQSSVRLGLEFLILTAARPNEAQLARWPEIDIDAKTWTVPGSRMKNGREHRVPLSTRALEVLKEARSLTDGQTWVFPGSKPHQPLSNMTFLKAARRLATVPLTAHGFRSSFRDWTSEKTNAPHAVCEAALAHTLRDKTEAAYHRTDLFDRRRVLMEDWARFATDSLPEQSVTVELVSRASRQTLDRSA